MTTTWFAALASASPAGNNSNNGLSTGAPKTLAGAVAAAGNGDTISLNDGIYPRIIISNLTNVTFVSTNIPTRQTITGFASGHPCRLNRTVQINTLTLRSCIGCDFYNIHFVFDQWYDTTTGIIQNDPWYSLSGSGGSDGNGFVSGDAGCGLLRFYGCEWSWGYGATQDPFNATTYGDLTQAGAFFPEIQTGAFGSSNHNAPGRGDPYQSWWNRDDTVTNVNGTNPTPYTSGPQVGTVGVPNGSAYNTLDGGPHAFGSNASVPAQFYYCDFHDISRTMGAPVDSGLFLMDQCWFRRVYGQNMILTSSGIAVTGAGCQITRCIFENFISTGTDSGNPHGDIIQHFSQIGAFPNISAGFGYGWNPSTSGGSLTTGAFHVIISATDTTSGIENYVYHESGAIAVTGSTGSISVTLPTRAGATWTAYIGTTSSPTHLAACVSGTGGQSTGMTNGATVILTAVGNARTPPAETVDKQPGMVFERIFNIQRPTDRGAAQFLFLEGGRSGSHPLTYQNPRIRNLLACQFSDNLGIDLSIEDGNIDYNMCVLTPGHVAGTSIAIVIGPAVTGGFTGITHFQGNISESISSSSFQFGANNFSVGQGYSSISLAALTTGTFPPTDVTYGSASAWYAGLARHATYAGAGPQYTTLDHFVNDALTTSDVNVFVGFAGKAGLFPGVSVLSDLSAIRGPAGDNITVAVDKGDFQITDISGTILRAFGAGGSFTAIAGQYVQLTHTASASFQTNVTQTVTLTHAIQGAIQFHFISSTQSNIGFPVINLAATPVIPSLSGTIGADTGKFFMAFKFRLHQEPTQSGGYYLFGDSNSSAIGPSIRVIGIDASTAKLRLGINTVTASNVYTNNVDTTSGTLDFVSDYMLVWAVDSSDASKCIQFVYNITNSTVISFVSPTIVVNSLAAFGATYLWQLNTTSLGAAPDISFLLLALNQWTNPSTDTTLLQRLSGAYIGPDGEGVFGVKPEVFLCGPAGNTSISNSWNSSTGLNLGSITPKFIIGTGAATDVTVNPWPPILTLSATLQSASPFKNGDKVQFLVAPGGYGVACNITPASNGAGVWTTLSGTNLAVGGSTPMPVGSGGVGLIFYPTAAGTHAITFTNDASQINPSSQNVVVNDLHTVIPIGTTVSITQAQAAVLDGISFGQNANTNAGFTSLSWNTNPSETGPLTQYGVGFSIN